jgi:hypothetical protein
MTSAKRLVSVLITAIIGYWVEKPNASIRLDIRREGDAAFIRNCARDSCPTGSEGLGFGTVD